MIGGEYKQNNRDVISVIYYRYDNDWEEAGFRHTEYAEFGRLSDYNQTAQKSAITLARTEVVLRPAVYIFLESLI